MNTRNVIVSGVIIIIIVGISLSYQLSQTPQKPEVIDLALDYNPSGERVNINSDIFNVYSYAEEWNSRIQAFNFVWIEKKSDYDYSKIEAGNQKTVFIIPIFTLSAYWSPGFYDYYNKECNETCLTTKLDNDVPFSYESSGVGIQVLSLLGYDYITDVEVANNPNILNRYDKIIILHNEYVTSKEFEAITNHPKVMYLYPNALYAEVEYNQENSTLTLVRGHGYPEKTISNGFDWEFDNTHPYEFDTECINWKFYEIDNGIMLNCYPERIIGIDFLLLKSIKDY